MGLRPRRRLFWLLFAAAVVAGLAAAYFGGTLIAGLETRGERIHFVYLGLLLVFLLASAGMRWRSRPATHLRHALVWASVALVLVIAYSFRYEIASLAQRVKGELPPSSGVESAPGRVAFRASVNRAPMNDSLPGMSFLTRLSGYSVEGGVLTLVR
jgi:predicted aspartyl protease